MHAGGSLWTRPCRPLSDTSFLDDTLCLSIPGCIRSLYVRSDLFLLLWNTNLELEFYGPFLPHDRMVCTQQDSAGAMVHYPIGVWASIMTVYRVCSKKSIYSEWLQSILLFPFNNCVSSESQLRGSLFSTRTSKYHE